MPSWRLLTTSWPDREFNLAFEWALLEAVKNGYSPSTVRIWVNGPCVVVDRSARSLDEVRREACLELGLPVLRRPTAGGAVYHDEGNLNWTLVLRREDLGPLRWPRQLEEKASRALLELLASLGLRGEFRPGEGVFLGGAKVSGMASYVSRTAVLVHGTLLVCSDLGALRKALRCKFEVANLAERCGLDLEPLALGANLAVRLASSFGSGLVEKPALRHELELAEHLRDRACLPGWPEGR